MSLIWLIPWGLWGPRDRALAISHSAQAPGILEILGKRDAWGTFFGLFGASYYWYFLLTWLPMYLVKQRHFSESMMAILGSLPFWGIAFSAISNGWISDRWILRGGSPTMVRKFFVVTGLLTGLLLVPAAVVGDPVVCMILLVTASLCFGLCSSNVWAVTQTLAGPAASGKWTGLQNGFGNLAGIVPPYLTGLFVKEPNSYFLAFLAAGLASAGGGLCFCWWLERSSP